MSWANSKVFVAFPTEAFKNTTAYDLDTDTFKAALYNDAITPDQTVSQANTAYNVGQWANTNEVTSTGEWDAGGVALTTPAISNDTTTTVKWDAVDTASAAGATLSATYGTLVYDTSVSSYGICYNYFGGPNSVTNGTFTIVWNTNGIMRFSL